MNHNTPETEVQTYQQWAAEKVYRLLLKSTERQARVINAFVDSLLSPKKKPTKRASA